MATPARVRFQYPVAPDFRRLPVTGVIGGVSPAGFVMANLFTELHRLPAEQTATLQPDGQLLMDPDAPAEAVIQRELLVGLMMTPEVALSIGQWITATAQGALAQRAQQGAGKAN